MRGRVSEAAEDQKAYQSIPGVGKERDTQERRGASQGSSLHTASGADALDYPANDRRGKRLRNEEERDRDAERSRTETKLVPNLDREPANQKNREHPARGDRDSPKNNPPPRLIASIGSHPQISGDVGKHGTRSNRIFVPRRRFSASSEHPENLPPLGARLYGLSTGPRRQPLLETSNFCRYLPGRAGVFIESKLRCSERSHRRRPGRCARSRAKAYSRLHHRRERTRGYEVGPGRACILSIMTPPVYPGDRTARRTPTAHQGRHLPERGTFPPLLPSVRCQRGRVTRRWSRGRRPRP